jgi:hypothetical protein
MKQLALMMLALTMLTSAQALAQQAAAPTPAPAPAPAEQPAAQPPAEQAQGQAQGQAATAPAPTPATPEAQAAENAAIPDAPAPGDPVFSDEQYGSLVFTYWEHAAIKDAKNARGFQRAPSEAELMRDLKTKKDDVKKVKPPPEKREIRLAGIVYHGAKDWVIWLNEQRVTPDALPPEILDMKVYKGYIELKWFDDWTNQIYPIRLRPHQRFNIDARMFLPGR